MLRYRHALHEVHPVVGSM